jgi:hypothetical protein
MCIVLVALGGSPVLLPAGGHDEAESTSTGGQPCIVPANGQELCGHDAAIWCHLRPSGDATRDDCVPVLRWTSY